METFKKRQTEKTPYLILGSFFCLLIGTMLAVLPKIYGPATMVKMEFGYWAHAADMAGMDWKETVSLNTWYSYGYGLLIFPFMKMISNPLITYRCMVVVNFILLGICMLIAYKLLMAIFTDMKAYTAAFVSGASMCYVSYITYAQTTIPEVLLTFLYLLTAYGLYRWFKYQELWSGLLVILTSWYMYTVHMRTIGIFLSAVVCMFMAALFKTERKNVRKTVLIVLSIAALTVVLIFLAGAIKESAISSVASEQYGKMTSVNDYSGQWGKLKFLCSFEGMYHFLTGFAGKIFYLGCASFGLYYWGMAFLLKKAEEFLICLIKKKKSSWRDWIFFWCLLSHISAVVISTVYWLRGNRLDGILYGRYHENTIPLIMAFGIVSLLEKPQIKRRLLQLLALSGILMFFTYSLIDIENIIYYNRDSVMGILYAIDYADGYFGKTILCVYIVGGVGSLLILGIVWLTDGGKKRKGLLSGICLLQLVLTLYTDKNYIFDANASQKDDMQLLSQVRQMIDLRKEDKALYLYDDNEMTAYLAQYMLNDISLKICSKEEIRGADADLFVITQNGDEMEMELSIYYTNVLESPHYRIYYNEFD